MRGGWRRRTSGAGLFAMVWRGQRHLVHETPEIRAEIYLARLVDLEDCRNSIARRILASSRKLSERRIMKSSYIEWRTRTVSLTRMFAIPALMVALAVAGLSATANAAISAEAAASMGPETYHVLYLTGVVRQSDAIDIVTDLRSLLPRARVFYVASRNAISMMSTEHDFEIAQKVVTEMSQGPRVFRLTYTLTDSGGGKSAGHHSVAVVVASGENASIKQGERVPIVTGRDSAGAGRSSDQMQYLDVGLHLNASLSGPANDLVLQTQVVQSAVVPEKSVAGLPDPILRQTTLDSTAIVTVGKPLILGSLDIPGTAKQEQIEVTAEPVE